MSVQKKLVNKICEVTFLVLNAFFKKLKLVYFKKKYNKMPFNRPISDNLQTSNEICLNAD